MSRKSKHNGGEIKKGVGRPRGPGDYRHRPRTSLKAAALRDEFLSRIEEEMEEQGWTQASLARNLGVHESTISYIFNGHRAMSLPMLVLLAEGVGLEVVGVRLRPLSRG